MPLSGLLYVWPGVDGGYSGELELHVQSCFHLSPLCPESVGSPSSVFWSLLLPPHHLSHLLFGCLASLGSWFIGFQLVCCFIVQCVCSSRKDLTVTNQ